MKETKQEIPKQYLYFSESKQELEKAGVGVTIAGPPGRETRGGRHSKAGTGENRAHLRA